MPINEHHQQQSGKNLALLAILAIVVALMYSLTWVRFQPDAETAIPPVSQERQP